MTLHSLMIASALAMGLAVPAMAQSSTMHRYVFFFKYSDAAVNEMTENRKIAQLRSRSCINWPAARWRASIGSRLGANTTEW